MLRTSTLIGFVLLPSLLLGQKPGTHARTIEVDGKSRGFLLHIPRGYKAAQKKTVSLVLMLHGRTSNGRAAASRYYGWRPLADKKKFFVVFPTALGTPTSWQGGWRGKPTTDSRFLATIIDQMIKEFRIDENRVYMTGHSSGGFMSFSFAATHADKVAAIGPVAGLAVSRSRPKEPVSVISFHGVADKVVAYDSKSGKRARYRGMPSAMDSAAIFAKHNGCAEQPVRKDTAKGMVHVDTWSGGRSGTEVVLYSIEDGNHGWPNGGRGTLSATKLIWEFFENHPRVAAKQKAATPKRSKQGSQGRE